MTEYTKFETTLWTIKLNISIYHLENPLAEPVVICIIRARLALSKAQIPTSYSSQSKLSLTLCQKLQLRFCPSSESFSKLDPSESRQVMRKVSRQLGRRRLIPEEEVEVVAAERLAHSYRALVVVGVGQSLALEAQVEQPVEVIQ